MKITFFLVLLTVSFAASSQNTNDKSPANTPIVSVTNIETERNCHLNLSIGNTMLLDTAITSFSGKRNFISVGTGFIFLNPETSKVRPFVNAEFCRYVQSYVENSLPDVKITNFNFSAGLNIPFTLSENQFFYVKTAINHGEFNSVQPAFYSRYFGVNIGVGIEKRIKANLTFFAEAEFNNNRALKKYIQQHEAYNLNTVCFKAGFRF